MQCRGDQKVAGFPKRTYALAAPSACKKQVSDSYHLNATEAIKTLGAFPLCLLEFLLFYLSEPGDKQLIFR